MSVIGFFLGAFVLVAVFSTLLALTYFLASARVEEAEQRAKTVGAAAVKSKVAESIGHRD